MLLPGCLINGINQGSGFSISKAGVTTPPPCFFQAAWYAAGYPTSLRIQIFLTNSLSKFINTACLLPLLFEG